MGIAQAELTVPLLPLAHARALALLGDDRATMKDIGRVVESDPALTGTVLRVANSAAMASRVRIRTAQDALVRIGLASTRRVIATTVVDRAFGDALELALDVEALWRHVLGTALLAHELVPEPRDRALAFTAGLLHDVGRLAMAGAEPERYMRVRAAVVRGVEPRRAEQLLFGQDHCAWGERVAEDWGLAPELVEAIRDHHGSRSSPLAAAVAEARDATAVLGVGDRVVRGVRQLVDESSRAFEALRRLVGVNGLFERIDWYRGAIDPAA